ncbi:MAG: hypothetical protein PWP11_3270 [Thauera sp.]|nr:hypothetical protein [Thauera sp.]MDI3491993.1 hypothetical protein [Thauera sp.]
MSDYLKVDQLHQARMRSGSEMLLDALRREHPRIVAHLTKAKREEGNEVDQPKFIMAHRPDPSRRTSSDSVWPLRRADGRTYAEVQPHYQPKVVEQRAERHTELRQMRDIFRGDD